MWWLSTNAHAKAHLIIIIILWIRRPWRETEIVSSFLRANSILRREVPQHNFGIGKVRGYTFRQCIKSYQSFDRDSSLVGFHPINTCQIEL